MKNITKFLFIFAVMLTSCSDLLDETPQGFKDPDNYYNTNTAIIQSANGLYSRLKLGGVYGRALPMVSDIYGTLSKVTSTEYDNFTWAGTNILLPTNEVLTQIWQHHYKGINDCNTTIDRVGESQGNLTPELRSRVIGEARFIRALLYFNLVRCWQEVPLRVSRTMHDTEIPIPIAPLRDIYDTIIADLIYAEENLWNKGQTVAGIRNEVGRATKLAAQHLLSKVYLEIASSTRYAMSDNPSPADDAAAAPDQSYNKIYTDYYSDTDAATYYNLAKDAVTRAMENPDFGMLDSFGDIWDINNQNNKEIIFAAQYAPQTGYGSSFFTLYTPKESDINQPKAGGVTGLSVTFYKTLRDIDDKHEYDHYNFKVYSDVPTKTGKLDNIDGDKRISEGLLLSFNSTEVSAVDNKGNVLTNAAWQDWNSSLSYKIYYFDGSIKYQNVPNEGMFFYSKFVDEGCAIAGTSGLDFPILRASELYLIRAEVLAEIALNPAAGLEDYNVVRRRGNPDRLLEITADGAAGSLKTINFTYTTASGATESGTKQFNTDGLGMYPGKTDMERFHNAILRERAMEFMGEGYRFFDLKRLGQLAKFTSIFNAGNRRPHPYQYYWPIPQSEMDTNTAITEQKQGY